MSQQGAAGVSKGAKNGVVLVILIAAISLFFLAVFSKSGPKGTKIISEGDRAPEFSLSGLDGKEVSLSALRGKVVMVHFWATWCPPCVDEIPALERLYHRLKDGNFRMMAVSVDEGGADSVSGFMKQNSLTLPVLFDPDRSVARRYGTFKFPETYIIDEDGTVRYKVIGPGNWDDPATIRALQELTGKA